MPRDESTGLSAISHSISRFNGALNHRFPESPAFWLTKEVSRTNLDVDPGFPVNLRY